MPIDADRRDHDDDHDRGLAYDLKTLVARRGALKLFAGAGAGLVLAACQAPIGSGGGTATTTTSGSGGSTTTAAGAGGSTAACTPIPDETAGPYPGDGTNGPNILTQSGIVRRDIRSSFGSSTTTAAGVPLTITLEILDTAAGCAPLEGAAVYLWHCDRDGNYSMYARAIAGENYLRGVQVSDGDGAVTFESVFPAAYSGRWPHAHFEVYETLGAATSGRNAIATSQLALPEDVCRTVYATDGYASSVTNLNQTSLARDMVFSDGWTDQLATTTGDVASGYTASLTVPV
jgi:protocatechuate 3,4-dioxygenase beta subunit